MLADLEDASMTLTMHRVEISGDTSIMLTMHQLWVRSKRMTGLNGMLRIRLVGQGGT